MELLTSCRWLTPVALVRACLLASPGSRLTRLPLQICRSAKLHKFGESVPFRLVPSCTLVVELYVFSSTSAPGPSISLMICRQGLCVTTVAAFPQLKCYRKMWSRLLPFTIVATTSPAGLILLAWAVRNLASSDF